ncbi:hypothetical protein B5P19_15975 [Clavibacter sepedonicus]|uniref:Uncharacterized protein n=1 Tax=Clavibacter sepedonicus TaxID=31964 RepID=B0RJ24_CLASE|nr:hypothetical protein B5P19_15975 [Clavibacter sepedonicus]OQJ50892.1 hypothetical protein B5P20_15775 [Clavibacter sepedonicus]CAQ03213.1 hypothetical protein pCS0030 [Clavibacter sepedonicus]
MNPGHRVVVLYVLRASQQVCTGHAHSRMRCCVVLGGVAGAWVNPHNLRRGSQTADYREKGRV